MSKLGLLLVFIQDIDYTRLVTTISAKMIEIFDKIYSGI